MRKLLLPVLAVMAVLAAFSVPHQARAQARIKVNKAPKYADDVFVPEKNALYLRVPIGFYAYVFASSEYKNRHTPVLLGARYEHLVKSRTGFGLELEYNSFQRGSGVPNEDTDILPPKENTLKVTPFLKFYTRTNKKNFFVGPYATLGPTLMFISQDQDLNALLRPKYIYKSNTVLGIDLAIGAQVIFKRSVILGASAEGIFTGAQFRQEGYFRKSIGNGTAFLNPFKFSVGFKF